jgi:hypothetical protein
MLKLNELPGSELILLINFATMAYFQNGDNFFCFIELVDDAVTRSL